MLGFPSFMKCSTHRLVSCHPRECCLWLLCSRNKLGFLRVSEKKKKKKKKKRNKGICVYVCYHSCSWGGSLLPFLLLGTWQSPAPSRQRCYSCSSDSLGMETDAYRRLECTPSPHHHLLSFFLQQKSLDKKDEDRDCIKL